MHVNEPGRAEWEGFDTATRAAASGGVTTIVDMPLNSVPATTTVEALEEKRRAASGKCQVDVGFWGGVVPGNQGELRRGSPKRRRREGGRLATTSISTLNGSRRNRTGPGSPPDRLKPKSKRFG